MQNVDKKKAANLTVIKGGKLTPREFVRLPLGEKIEQLRELGAKGKMDLILSDPEGERVVRALPPQELFWTVKEVGEHDAIELIKLASPEQLGFFLDMELWERWTLSPEKTREWLGYLIECGEDKVAELLPELDPELLTLVFMREISVGGGIGELVTDEERLADWDHTFDNLYFITFRNPKNARLIGSFLDIVCRRNHPLYLTLMEAVRSEAEGELEELAYGFRSGRLADMGFPELDEALAIYAWIDPAAFVPAREKERLPVAGGAVMPAPLPAESLLGRVLARAASEDLYLELNYLVNSALVAEGTPFPDGSAMEDVFRRVDGYLTIALEFLAGGDEAEAAGIVRNEYLKRLFQLGHSIIIRLKRGAEKLSAESVRYGYATGKALEGLKAGHPKFYRGLDPDAADGYREFRGMEDVRRMEEFLKSLKGA